MLCKLGDALFIHSKQNTFITIQCFLYLQCVSLPDQYLFFLMSEVLDMILKDYAFVEMILSISLSC